MATHNPTYPAAGAGASTTSRGPVAAAVLVTACFAFLAFRLSFEALTALADEHGVAGDVAWMFAVLVDGGAVVGTVGVVAAKRAGRPVAVYWVTVASFAGVSLAFNVAHSDGTPLGVAIAVVPPVAQLVATELLVRMLPAGDTVTAVDTVAPAVARAVAAADAARTAAAGLDAARAAAVKAATVATDAAGRAEQVAVSVATVAAPPLALVDLAAAVAAVDEQPARTVAPTDAPAPLPLAAVFTAPPLPTPSPDDDEPAGDGPGDDEVTVAGDVPADAVAAYRRLRRTSGQRPTAEALGQALGLKRTRGSELRTAVEQALGIRVAAVIKS
ncbi:MULTISPECIES: DUF2637 domain-containing protein [unclassified Streptomyces]|uniref:DUF2637 domain-containing protein n=1 Tax=unclassified Streptomyces TaxID=2593676 RepID=UPI0037FD9BED